MPAPENRAQALPSLLHKLVSVLVLLVTLVSVAGSLINYVYFAQQVRRDQQNRSAEYAEYLRDSLEWPLWNIDDELITKIGAAFAANPELATLIVRDEAQRVIYRQEEPQSLQNRQVIGIDHAGHPIGSVEFGISLASFEERERQLWLTSLATTALLIILLIAAIRGILSRTLKKPIDAMIAATQAMVDGSYQQIKLPATYQEFAAILTGFKTMSEAVASREERLRQSNAQLALEVAERQHAEQEISALNATLEQRITERTAELAAKTAELARTSERLHLAMEASTDGLWDRNVQTGAAYYSPGWFTMLGYRPDELPHHVDTWLNLLHPVDRQTLEAIEAQKFAADRFEMEFRMRTKAGPYRWIHSRGRIVARDADGRPLRAVGTHVDITERKEATLALEESEHRYRDLSASLEEKVAERTAQLAAASAAKSQFLAHMSHEIRTPMNAILGLSQILQNEGLPPAQADLLHKVSAAGDSLLHIINDILDIAKIEACQLVIDAKPFRLSAVMTRIKQLLQHTASAKGLALQLPAISGDTDALIGDRLRLEQVLINLVSNAIKFTARGSVTLAVTPLVEEGAAVRLRFAVRDTGIGMDPDALARLFQPFSQGDASITRRFGGTGLGLAISKQLVELMSGVIGVESEAGQGSTFWFEIPFPKASPELTPSSQPTPAEGTPSGPVLAGLRVLEVDDNRINLLVVERALQQAGAVVTLAADGRQALDILEARPGDFDVVLMDIQMPVMDGLTATREIRRNPALAALPVVALSAGVLAGERAAALEAGVNDFLAKPLDLRQMHAVLSPYAPA